MTRIAATDQILLLLREQLQRNDRTRTAAKSDDRAERLTAHQRIEALATAENLPERDFRRAVVRSLLSERLGEKLVSDPAFEAIVAEVSNIIENSPDTRQLLDDVGTHLRRG